MTRRMLVLKTAWQIRAAMHPQRIEILERLHSDGPDSIAGLAAKLERPANALTYHVRLLEKAGVLVAQGKRRAGRRFETVYTLVPGRLAVGGDAKSASAMRAAAQAATALCRMTDREIRHALAQGLITGGAPVGRRHRVRLTEKDAAAVQSKLSDIERILERARRRKQGRPHAFTAFLVPLGTERKD